VGEQLKKTVESNERFTVGFLDENTYYDYHNLILNGICKAARKFDLNIIRISHFIGHAVVNDESHENVSIDIIKQFKLDGLITLGWARLLSGKDFRDVFGDLPLFNLGTAQKGIPSAIFPGANYVRDLLLHLIKVHHFENIAFIAPYWYDPRIDCYIETMKIHGIYNPQLYVEDSDMQNLDYYGRGVRAVQILLDERLVKLDAIVSLYSDEAYAVFNELRRRGIRIPEDVALTSYEDGETGKFSSPAFTTIYFPWEELGYFACESMNNLLRGKQVPLVTSIPGRIIYRGSCGCIPDTVKSSGTGSLQSASKCFEELGDEEYNGIIHSIAGDTGIKCSEIERLMKDFVLDFKSGGINTFLSEIEILFRKIKSNSRNSGIDTIAAILRRHLLPYFLPYSGVADDKLVWAEDIFLQVQVMLQNKLANVSFREDVTQKNIRLKLKEIGQILIANFTVSNLLDSLEINLPKLEINSCYIYLFGKDGNGFNLKDNRLEFKYNGSGRFGADHGIGLNESLNILMKESGICLLTAHLLHNGDDFIGIVLFEPTYMDMGIYQSITMQLSAALNGIILFEKLDASYRRLMDRAHKKGMADISTGILHNIGNILNNVNVTVYSLTKLLDDNTINDLIMANTLLGSRFDDLDEFIRLDPKGRTLMQFYVSLTDVFEDFRSKLQDNVERLSNKINLIDEIVTAQQSYTTIKSSLKALDIIVVVEDVLKMHQTTIEKHGIQVTRNYGRTAKALANRTKLFHVLTNIIKNAIEAMEATLVEHRKLSITVISESGKIFLRISDSGDGIAPDHLEDIFAYGFSTKTDGHGFGLHSCANYMTEMNGRLWAESSGKGMGATFVLQLKKQDELIDKG
jgi:signal transduction histidine kinase/DNA-binding LacI/PurR family transcriptional regulator